jgi:hypothetical protein
MPSKGSTSSNKKKATARGRAAEKAGGDTRLRGSVKQISQGRVPGERALTGEDRPADRKGGKVSGGPSAKPRGRRGVQEAQHKGATDQSPDTSTARPVPTGRHMN